MVDGSIWMYQCDDGWIDGPDQLHPRLLYELADNISMPITFLFNSSLKYGNLPKIWRRAFIWHSFQNSRHLPIVQLGPISLTAILCKIIGTIYTRSYTSSQRIRISSRKIHDQALTLSWGIYEEYSRRGTVDSIHLYFSKAFERYCTKDY